MLNIRQSTCAFIDSTVIMDCIYFLLRMLVMDVAQHPTMAAKLAQDKANYQKVLSACMVSV
jgi:hypothetical protein